MPAKASPNMMYRMTRNQKPTRNALTGNMVIIHKTIRVIPAALLTRGAKKPPVAVVKINR